MDKGRNRLIKCKGWYLVIKNSTISNLVYTRIYMSVRNLYKLQVKVYGVISFKVLLLSVYLKNQKVSCVFNTNVI